MGYKCSFIDNEVYGADDVSEAFSNILSGGVVVECDSENVIGTLNSLTGEIITEGTRSYTDLQVSVADGMAKIGEGTGFFESGVSVTVDADGVILDTKGRASGYVSILYDPDLNCVLPQITDAVPEGDVLLLARFDGDEVTDLRSYARSKLSINSANTYHDFSISIKWFRNLGQVCEENTATYRMPHTGFRYLLLRKVTCDVLPLGLHDSVLDLTKEGEQLFVLRDDSIGSWLGVERDGDLLTFHAYYTNTPRPQSYELTLA